MEPRTKLVHHSAGKRPPAAGKGRPKGAVNKSTRNAREAIAALVDANAERMQGWLDEIATHDGPKAAWQCMMDVIEYHIPKLARTELRGPGEDGAHLIQRVERAIIGPNTPD